jgi:hypothetical protein
MAELGPVPSETKRTQGRSDSTDTGEQKEIKIYRPFFVFSSNN